MQKVIEEYPPLVNFGFEHNNPFFIYSSALLYPMAKTKDDFLKKFREAHKDELEEIAKLQSILNQIKAAEQGKAQYFTQIQFNVQ